MGTPGKTGMGINWNNRKMGITGIPEKMGWGSWKHRDWNHGNSQEKWDGNSQKHQHGDSQEFLGKKGLAPGIPKKTGWTSEIPGKNGIGSSNSLGKWDGDSQETGMDAGNSQENRIHSQKKKKGWVCIGNQELGIGVGIKDQILLGSGI